jgi:hypothetical protein
MNISKILGIILLLAGVVLAYQGIMTFQNSTASAEILGVELTASDEGGQMTSFIYLGLAVFSGIGGIYLLGQKS